MNDDANSDVVILIYSNNGLFAINKLPFMVLSLIFSSC